jgi:hypothetical protein
MKDARGNTMVKGDGERYLIKDDRAMKTHRKEIAAELGENPKKLYPVSALLGATVVNC